MCRLVETIKLKDGIFENLEIHNERFNNSRKAFFGVKEYLDLNEILKSCEFEKNGLFKCRVIYYKKEIVRVEFIPYVLRQVKSLKIVEADVDYSYKYEDKSNINKLLDLRDNCDDILILKNNRLTDTSAANIAFFDNDRWYTPLYPLLKGTKREKLLREKVIFEEDLTLSNLKRFSKAALFNTMVDFGETILPVSNIVY